MNELPSTGQSQNETATDDAGQAQIQVLVRSRGDRRGLQEILRDQYEVITDETVQPADGYLLDSKLYDHYSETLRQRKSAEQPAFCPVLLVRTDQTDSSTGSVESDEDGVLIDDVMNAPVDPPLLHRRLQNLLVRREQSLELTQRYEEVEAWFQALFRGIPNPAFVLDEQGVIAEANEAFCTATGTSREAIQGKPLGALENFGLEPDAVLAQLGEKDHKRPGNTAVVPYVDATDTTKYGLLSVQRETVGGETFTIGVLSDITQQKNQEEKLRKARDDLAALLEVSQELIETRDPEAVAVSIAEATTSALGYESCVVRRYDPEADRLFPVADGLGYVDAADRPSYEPGEGGPGTAFATGETLLYPDEVGDETVNAPEYLGSCLYVPLGDLGVVSIASKDPDGFSDRDRSIMEVLGSTAVLAFDRAKQESDLRETEERLRLALEATDTGTWLWQLDTGEMIWSEEAERLAGLEPGTFEGTADAFLDRIHPEDRQAISEAVEAAAQNEQMVQVEFRIQLPDGEYRWIEARGEYVEDDESEHIIGISTDITERKEREQRLQTTNEQLEVLNRVLRHDIRNDIQVLQMHGEGLLQKVEEKHRSDVRRILKSVKHINNLTEDSRDFIRGIARDEAVETEPTRLDTILTDELDKARSRYPEAAFHVEKPLPAVTVLGNDLLASVVRNLLNNAVQHNRGDPHVEVSIEQSETDSLARLTVADDGPGIPDEMKSTIFGKGKRGLESESTGIGLYLVHKLIDSYGGEVWVEDNEPTGSVFVVELPLTDDWA